ncbi:MAG: hypothetical protein AAFV43_03735 [Planctomycetota bacterium]
MTAPMLARCVTTLLVAGLAACAEAVLIDDFTQTDDPSIYPKTQFALEPLEIVADPAANVFGGVRGFALLPQTLTVPVPATVAMTTDLDTTAGELTTTASSDAAFQFALFWSSDDIDTPVGFDLTPFNRFVIEYSANAAMEIEVVLSNVAPGSTAPVAGLQRTLALPAATDGIYEIALMDINELVPDVLGTPIGGPTVFFPSLDPTSLDGISFIISSATPGASLTLSSVQLIPEPVILGPLAVVTLMTVRPRSHR